MNHHFADAHAPPRLHIQFHVRPQRPRLRIEVAEYLGVRITDVAEPRHNRVGGRLHQEAIERITHLQRQIAFQSLDIDNAVDAFHVDPSHPHRFPFVDAKREIDIARRATYQRVHHRVHESTLSIQQNQPHDVAAKLYLTEIALFAKPEPPH